MTGWRPQLVPPEPDQVPRLQRFRAEHPDVAVLLKTAVPTAFIGSRKVTALTLRDLLDKLEELFSPGKPQGKLPT